MSLIDFIFSKKRQKQNKKISKALLNSSSSLDCRASIPGYTLTELGPRVYSFLPQAAVLPKSDAGSDVVEHRV